MNEKCHCKTRQGRDCKRKPKTEMEDGTLLCRYHGDYEGRDCPVCKMSLDFHSVSMSCGHGIHTSCARSLFEKNGGYLIGVSCPVCRTVCKPPAELWKNGTFKFSVKEVMKALERSVCDGIKEETTCSIAKAT